MWTSTACLAVLSASFYHVTAQSVVSLSSVAWTVGNGNNVTVIPAKFPSQSHLDLFAAGIIKDPLYGQNDYEQLWVQRSNWTYQSSPLTGISYDANKTTWLVFEGLDTFTYIEMCGKAVGNTDNMYRQWYFDVTEILPFCTQRAILSLNFGSASKIVLDIANSSSGDPQDNFADNVKGQEFDGKVYARKEQNDFGWDWSPSFSPAGPYRPASVVQMQSNEMYVRNAAIDIYREEQMPNISPDQTKSWIFNASIDFLGTLPKSASMKLALADASGNKILEAPLGSVYSNNETVTGHTTIDPAKVSLWYPNGLGPQTLYNATITISDESGHSVATINRRVGFRTIVLNLNPITDDQLAQGIAPGSNWHFEVNGHEFYAKGSNLVPPDVFWARVNQTKMEQLFEAAQEANMNMLRVWASGLYLPDFIYDIADEKGILLWSEFQFTDAKYPTNPQQIANYEAEAYYNVRRINHHASVALWAGGNELESVDLAYFHTGYLHDQYELLVLEILIKCVYANTRSISYMPSSTYNGYTNLNFSSTRPQTPRYTATQGPDYLYKNSDFYDDNYNEAFTLSAFPVARFADEFGFISMPSTQSWLEITPADTLTGMEADIVQHRNRHEEFGGGSGITAMTGASAMWYPKIVKKDQLANFTAWAYTSQVYQADYYRNQIAFYRRGSGMRERQLGSLYWMLEDLWVGSTWAGIEANGRQKLLHYIAKDIYQPLIIHPYNNLTAGQPAPSVDVYVTSDAWSAVSGSATFDWLDWSGNPLQVFDTSIPESASGNASSFAIPFTVGAINTTRVLSYPDLSKLTFTSAANTTTSSSNSSTKGAASSAPLSNALLRMTATSGSQTHTAWFHPRALSDSNLQDPGLAVTPIKGQTGVAFRVTATKAVAAWVFLEHQTAQVQGYFEANGFWLAKGEHRDVGFKVWNDWTGDGRWADGVVVRSLWDNTVA